MLDCLLLHLRGKPQEEILQRFLDQIGFPLKFTLLPTHRYHNIDMLPLIPFRNWALTSDDIVSYGKVRSMKLTLWSLIKPSNLTTHSP